MKNGFTLVELSIVLVILGLLVGGVLAGQSLIHSAELRALVTEYDKFRVANNAFRDKYFGIAGDITNATAFWGSAGGTGSDGACANSTGTPPQTCNGNGDGFVTEQDGIIAQTNEDLRHWQQLANAGLIEGQFNGRWPAAPPVFVGGVNVPASKVGGVFYMWGTANWSANTTTFAGPWGNVITLFEPSTGSNNVMTSEDAWNVDSKLDDARPASGRIIGWKGDATYACTSNANNATDDPAATYSLNVPGKICSLLAVKN